MVFCKTTDNVFDSIEINVKCCAQEKIRIVYTFGYKVCYNMSQS